jgi:hypothetical protein
LLKKRRRRKGRSWLNCGCDRSRKERQLEPGSRPEVFADPRRVVEALGGSWWNGRKRKSCGFFFSPETDSERKTVDWLRKRLELAPGPPVATPGRESLVVLL